MYVYAVRTKVINSFIAHTAFINIHLKECSTLRFMCPAVFSLFVIFLTCRAFLNDTHRVHISSNDLLSVTEKLNRWTVKFLCGKCRNCRYVYGSEHWLLCNTRVRTRQKLTSHSIFDVVLVALSLSLAAINLSIKHCSFELFEIFYM